MIGQTILHYHITEKLGQGGMGVVYKAHDTNLERDVAIKFLPHEIIAKSLEQKRFKREAKAAAALSHANIATIHAIEETEQELFIVLEYVDGQELKDKIAQRPMPLAELLDITLQMLDGLQEAHEHVILAPRPNFDLQPGVSPHRVFLNEPEVTTVLDLQGSILLGGLAGGNPSDIELFHEKGGYFSIDVNLAFLPFMAKRLSQGETTVGIAMQNGINDAMRYFAITELDLKSDVLVQVMALTFPVGNPLHKPQLKMSVPLYDPIPL
jgi:hypothetical protein